MRGAAAVGVGGGRCTWRPGCHAGGGCRGLCGLPALAATRVQMHTRAATWPLLLQCKGVLPAEELPDGSKPPQKWNHYQLWWQTILTTAAPELRAMGWSNLKCGAGWQG